MLIHTITQTPVGADVSALRGPSHYLANFVNPHYRPSVDVTMSKTNS